MVILVGALLVLIGVVFGPMALLLSGAVAVLFRTILSAVETLMSWRPLSTGIREPDRP